MAQDHRRLSRLPVQAEASALQHRSALRLGATDDGRPADEAVVERPCLSKDYGNCAALYCMRGDRLRNHDVAMTHSFARGLLARSCLVG